MTERIDYQFERPAVVSRGLRQPISPEIVTGIAQIADFGLILLAAWLSFRVYLVGYLGDAPAFDRYLLTATLSAICFIFVSRQLRAYTIPRLSRFGWQVSHVTLAWAGTASFLAVAGFLAKVTEVYSRGWVVTWAVLMLVLLGLSRVVSKLLIRQWTQQGKLQRTIAIVGAGCVGEELVAKLKSAEGDIAIVGIFDDRLSRVPRAIAGCEVLGTTDRLIALAQRSRIDEIIIALPLRAVERIGEIITKLRILPVDLRLSIDPIAGAFPMRGISETASVPVIEILDRPLKDWGGLAKRIEDMALGFAGLVFFAPLMALIAVAIRLDSKGPIFFVQDRFGLNNEPIGVLKFRTMHVETQDPSGANRTVPDDPRVTRIGRILRRYSLDELPQLLNVLTGNMSLVGPRPHALGMKAGDRLYHDAVREYFRRHRVRPGMTGWAQVNNLRGEIGTVEKARQRVAYDLYYIDHWSVWFDLKILLLTARVVLSQQGAY